MLSHVTQRKSQQVLSNGLWANFLLIVGFRAQQVDMLRSAHQTQKDQILGS
jgi:hypothetical protein